MSTIESIATPLFQLESSAVSWVHKFVFSYTSLSKATILLNTHINNYALEREVKKGLCRAEFVDKEGIYLYGIDGSLLLKVNV